MCETVVIKYSGAFGEKQTLRMLPEWLFLIVGDFFFKRVGIEAHLATLPRWRDFLHGDILLICVGLREKWRKGFIGGPMCRMIMQRLRL